MYLVLILFSSICLSQSTYEQNAVSFSFDGISIGCHLSTFLQKYLTNITKMDDNDSAYGSSSYYIDSLNGATSGMFLFYQQSLYGIVYSYDADKITEMGGKRTIYDRLVKKLNIPDELREDDNCWSSDNIQEFVWEFKKGREFGLDIRKNGIVIIIAKNQLIVDKIKKVKAEKANVGF